MGGNVNQIEPVLDAKYFHKSPLNPRHVIGLHLLGKWLTGYGGKTAPPFNRFFIGGENDIRGFDILRHQPDRLRADRVVDSGIERGRHAARAVWSELHRPAGPGAA